MLFFFFLNAKLGIEIGKTMRMYLAKSRYEILKRERTLRRKFDENCFVFGNYIIK